MTADPKQPSSPAVGPRSVHFFYIKNMSFRVIHVDGAIGGITPTGKIHCAFYSERPAIPQETEFEISQEGRLGEQLSMEGKQGIVRELDVDAQMDVNTAIQLRDWLTRTIDEVAALPAMNKP